MSANNPYAHYVEGRDPVAVMAETTPRFQQIVSGMTTEQFNKSLAPGKWNAHKILVHVAQAELAFSTRVRYGLSTPDYVVQPFDQDLWLSVEEDVDGRTGFDAFVALRRLNLAFLPRLSAAQRSRTFTHPERGPIDVEDILLLMAGHEIHHFRQIEEIARI